MVILMVNNKVHVCIIDNGVFCGQVHLYKNMGNRKCMLRVAESVIDKPMKIKTSAIRMMKREMKSEQAQLLIEENNN